MSASTETAPHWLRELTSAQTYYIEQWGWPVDVEVRQHRLTVAVGDILDAITMPAALGRSVLADLKVAMLAGPIVAGPSTDRWTFFTQPTQVSQTVVPPDPRLAWVRLLPRGGRVVLPTDNNHPDENLGEAWSWIRPPQYPRVLPASAAVVATARRVVARWVSDRA